MESREYREFVEAVRDFGWIFGARWICFGIDERRPIGCIQSTKSSYDDSVILFKLSAQVDLILLIHKEDSLLLIPILIPHFVDFSVARFSLKILILVHQLGYSTFVILQIERILLLKP